MITIVTKNYCPFCTAAKQFLESIGKEYTEIEVSRDNDTYIQYQELSGMRTVPQIFDGTPGKETLIGGYDDMIEKYQSGNIFNEK